MDEGTAESETERIVEMGLRQYVIVLNIFKIVLKILKNVDFVWFGKLDQINQTYPYVAFKLDLSISILFWAKSTHMANIWV